LIQCRMGFVLVLIRTHTLLRKE